MTPAPPAPALVLHTVTDPARPAERVRFFRVWQSACEHLRDHLLTAPECHAWAVVRPNYKEVVNPADEDFRQAFARAMWETAGQSAQPLYDLYAQAVQAAAHDAAALGWHGKAEHTTAALGTDGVLLVIVARTVRTAFLPGQGDPATVEGAAATAAGDTELPRERRYRRPATAPRASGPPRNLRGPDDPDARVYYVSFRPAVQFVRARYHSYRDLRGCLRRCDYALLKPKLPPMSQLKLEHWRALRAHCGRTVKP